MQVLAQQASQLHLLQQQVHSRAPFTQQLQLR
jgi:hypothetical protein